MEGKVTKRKMLESISDFTDSSQLPTERLTKAELPRARVIDVYALLRKDDKGAVIEYDRLPESIQRQSVNNFIMEKDRLRAEKLRVEREAAAKQAKEEAMMTEEELNVREAQRMSSLTEKAQLRGEDTDEVEVLTRFRFKGENLLRSSINEVWEAGPRNTLGKWRGIFNPMRDMIVPAPEPEYE